MKILAGSKVFDARKDPIGMRMKREEAIKLIKVLKWELENRGEYIQVFYKHKEQAHFMESMKILAGKESITKRTPNVKVIDIRCK